MGVMNGGVPCAGESFEGKYFYYQKLQNLLQTMNFINHYYFIAKQIVKRKLNIFKIFDLFLLNFLLLFIYALIVLFLIFSVLLVGVSAAVRFRFPSLL